MQSYIQEVDVTIETRARPDRFWLTPVCALVVVAALLVFLRSNSSGEGNDTRNVLNITPYSGASDPGPTTLIGSEADANGTQFLWVDLYLEGNANCRVYFDRRDTTNFHFLDRVGTKITLGLSEAGLEQSFCTATLTSAEPLRVARHGCQIGVFQQGRLLLAAFDDRQRGGSVGIRTIANGSGGGGGAATATLKAEAREDIHFADDFMITEAKGAHWKGNGSPERGDFKVRSLRHPLLSANAFNYMGAGKGLYSVVGQPWWDQYRYEVSLRGPQNGIVGLVFAYQDDNNYGLFRWNARTAVEGGVFEGGWRELVAIRDGKETVLVHADGGYLPDQWYAASLRVTYGGVSVMMDGYELLHSYDAGLTCGGAGVWCDIPVPAILATDPKSQLFQENRLSGLMAQHCTIDDIRINSIEGFEDNFRTNGELGGGWLTGPGLWKCEAGKGLSVLPVSTSTKALIGDRRWSQYEVETQVQPGSGGAGITFLHRDESNYYCVTVDGKQLSLINVSNGEEKIVDSVPLPVAAAADKDGASWMHLKATVKHGHVRVVANDRATVESFAGDGLLKGRAGFVATSGKGDVASRFRSFRLSFLPEVEPLVTTNAVFEDELTMNDWTNPNSEWYPPKDQLLLEGRPVNLLWHRSQFPGDVELTLEPREITDDKKNEIAISVAKDGQGKNNGYVLRYKSASDEVGKRTTTVQLFRQGEMRSEKSVGDDVRQLSSISLRRCGRYVVGSINGRAIVNFRDDVPLSGSKVAYYTQGVLVRTEATKITSDNFRNDLFSRAATGWRIAGQAIAEVTNRWQCDPRWTFWSIENDRRKGKAAVMWSKYLYPGDCTIEFYVANKMEGERGQPYVYARDINVTLSSDGSDLTKGYTFMWGGKGNEASMILRDGIEVKRLPRSIPTDMNLHRHWFAYKVERQGNRVSFRVDRYFMNDKDGKEKQSELVYEDSQPLTGDRIAIWTYDHAIMISRVRISGDGGNVAEHPDSQTQPLKTPYDTKF